MVKGFIDAIEYYLVWTLTLESELPDDWYGKPGEGRPGKFQEIPDALVQRYKSLQHDCCQEEMIAPHIREPG